MSEQQLRSVSANYKNQDSRCSKVHNGRFGVSDARLYSRSRRPLVVFQHHPPSKRWIHTRLLRTYSSIGNISANTVGKWIEGSTQTGKAKEWVTEKKNMPKLGWGECRVSVKTSTRIPILSGAKSRILKTTYGWQSEASSCFTSKATRLSQWHIHMQLQIQI